MAAAQKRLSEATLNSFALSSFMLPEALSELESLLLSTTDSECEASAHAHVMVARLLYHSGRISYAQYAYQACRPVIGVHETRMMDGDSRYAVIETLWTIRRRIAEAEGLDENDDWIPEARPDVVRKLDDLEELISSHLEADILAEFELGEFAEMKRKRPMELDALIERGRRSIFHPRAKRAALADHISQLATEGAIASDAKAYLASCVAYGSAIEGLLTLKCLRNPEHAKAFAKQLFAPRKTGSIWRWDLKMLTGVCEAAGWLPTERTRVADFYPARLLDYVRFLRNLTHPSRAAHDRTWGMVGPREAQHAAAVYDLIRRLLSRRKAVTSPAPLE